ncbi:MAG: AAA family ATPase [Desulfurococcales archaeon]|nr:AAA family ATPase [Desulfurococcales archaeon]
MLFVDRDKELQALEKDISSPGLSITILYGRRRIGKTWILKKLIANHPSSLYFFVPEGPPQALFNMLQEKLEEKCGAIKARSWIKLIEELDKCSPDWRTSILLIDEFQRLGAGFISALQYYYDTSSGKPVKIVLAGSSASVVDKLAGPLGPLYGRARLVQLKGFGFLESYVYLSKKLNTTPLEAFRLYSILGGSPYNLSLAPTKDWKTIAREEIHSIFGRLYEEPIHILNSETREPGVYLGILEAASGHGSSYSKLASITGKTSLKRYIETLTSLGVLRKTTPYGYNPVKTRNTWYHVSDPYWDYWLKTIYPRRMEGELTGEIPVNEELAEEHFSIWFERTVRELLTVIHNTHVKPWWRKDVEIDAVVKGKTGIIAYEIKYKKLSEQEVDKILETLRVKAAKIGEPIEALGVISLDTPKPSGIQAEMYSFNELLEKALINKQIRAEKM